MLLSLALMLGSTIARRWFDLLGKTVLGTSTSLMQETFCRMQNGTKVDGGSLEK